MVRSIGNNCGEECYQRLRCYPVQDRVQVNSPYGNLSFLERADLRAAQIRISQLELYVLYVHTE